MAEESEVKESSSSTLDETKLAELIKSNVSSSVKDLLAQQTQNQQAQVEEPPVQQNTPEPDFWDNIINPKVDGKLQQAQLRAEAAEDQVDFRTSDFVLQELDEWIVAEDDAERKQEKKEFLAEVEKRFNSLLRQGKGFKREAIAHNLLGEKIAKDRIKYQENMGKKSKRKEENELEKARKAVSITSGTVSNFSAQDIHAMSSEKMLEQLGSLQF